MRRTGSVEALPDSVESLLAGEIDRLSPEDRTVLRYAAVLGTSFEHELLFAVVGKEVSLDDDVWARLAGLIDSEKDGVLRFRNALVRETAYEGLPYRRRRQLHRRVATTLEARVGESTGELAGRLTYHYYEAGNWSKTASYGWLAGKQARDVYANVDAAALLERALVATRRSRSTRSEVAGKVSELLADVHYALGDFDAAAATLRIARRRVTRDPVERARLTKKEAAAAVQFGRLTDARRLLVHAAAELEGVSSLPALAERAEIASWRAMVSLRQGRPRDAADWAQRAIDDAGAANAPAALGRGLMQLDLALVAQGRLADATHGEQALAVFDRLGDLNQKAFVWNNLGLIAYYEGQWDTALERYRRAKETWEQTGDRLSVFLADFNMGEILSGQGKLEDAEILLRNALRAARGTRTESDLAYVLLELGKIEARRGNLESAIRQLETSFAASEAAGATGAMLEVEARIAEAYLFAGDAEQARDRAGDVLARARSEAGTMTLPVLLRVLGQSCTLDGRVDEATRLFADALEAAEGANHAFEVALTLDLIADLGEAGGSNATVRRRRDELVAALGIVELPRASARALGK